jgi:hypothetical protein
MQSKIQHYMIPLLISILFSCMLVGVSGCGSMMKSMMEKKCLSIILARWISIKPIPP